MNLSTVRDIAATGVDRISVGALTHSAPALDIALDYQRSMAMPDHDPRETWHFDTDAHRTARAGLRLTSTAPTPLRAQLANRGRRRSRRSSPTTRPPAAGNTAACGKAGPEVRCSCRSCCSPPPELRRPVILTAFAAVAVAEAVYRAHRRTGPHQVAERPARPRQEGVRHPDRATRARPSIVGIGLNLNQTAEEFARARICRTRRRSRCFRASRSTPRTAAEAGAVTARPGISIDCWAASESRSKPTGSGGSGCSAGTSWSN